MPVQIEVLGTEETRKLLDNVDKEVRVNVSEAVMRAGFLLESEAKKVVHVISGRLRSDIRTQRLDEFAAKVFTDVDYAEIEQNRPGIREDVGTPHAFMTLALENKGKEAEQIIADAVQRGVKEA